MQDFFSFFSFLFHLSCEGQRSRTLAEAGLVEVSLVPARLASCVLVVDAPSGLPEIAVR